MLCDRNFFFFFFTNEDPMGKRLVFLLGPGHYASNTVLCDRKDRPRCKGSPFRLNQVTRATTRKLDSDFFFFFCRPLPPTCPPQPGLPPSTPRTSQDSTSNRNMVSFGRLTTSHHSRLIQDFLHQPQFLCRTGLVQTWARVYPLMLLITLKRMSCATARQCIGFGKGIIAQLLDA